MQKSIFGYLILVLVSALMLLSGCTGGDGVEEGVELSREDFGDDWPFTIPKGYADCVRGNAAVFRVELDYDDYLDGTYALTGAAMSAGYPEINPIWRDNPNIEGAKISIRPIIDIALEECD